MQFVIMFAVILFFGVLVNMEERDRQQRAFRRKLLKAIEPKASPVTVNVLTPSQPVMLLDERDVVADTFLEDCLGAK